MDVQRSGIESIIKWTEEHNRKTHAVINNIPFHNDEQWFIDEESGVLRHRKGAYFSVAGITASDVNGDFEQPIIIQPDIGFLGIICQKRAGTLYFLMQAKIEPGNINKTQISPTLQATKSNYERAHIGKEPAYLKYFMNREKATVLYDQVQSEQSSRFFQKRNRNIILLLDESEEIEILDTHMWMTLLQIERLLYMDNLVNMDTRSVLFGMSVFLDKANYNDVLESSRMKVDTFRFRGAIKQEKIVELYTIINNNKMFHENLLKIGRLDMLSYWEWQNGEFVCLNPWPFRIVYCSVEITGREISKWNQPMFAANGQGLLGLFVSFGEEATYVLVKPRKEVGCFDKIEIGPTIQMEPYQTQYDEVTKEFFVRLEKKEGVLYDICLSEEGGRFFHEVNRNVIIKVEQNEFVKSIEDSGEYIWCDCTTLCALGQVNNCLNIQLRNLMMVFTIISKNDYEE